MAYDEGLANWIRELIADDPDVTEKKMFGGPSRCEGASYRAGYESMLRAC